MYIKRQKYLDKLISYKAGGSISQKVLQIGSKEGKITEIKTNVTSLRKVKGIQVLQRQSKDEKEKLVYFFSVDSANEKICLDVTGYQLKDYYGNANIEQKGDRVTLNTNNISECGIVVLLSKIG